MLEWAGHHRVLLYWLTAAAAVMFVTTLLVVPALVSRIPADYFAHDRRPAGLWAHRHPALRVALAIAKNLLGYVLILDGLVRPALPGQGSLTFLIGFFLIDFPGKYRFERWLVSRRRVLKTVNWLRARRGSPPLRTAHAA